MSPPLALARPRSNNSKIGDAATTYAAQASCPSDCVFFDGGGCYAETGQLGKFVTAPLNAAAAGQAATGIDVALAEAQAIVDMQIEPGLPMRLHTVGDCSTKAAAQIVALAAADYRRRGGGPVWTYTHAWRTVPREAWGAVSVLASCETADDVALARSRGYATAIVVAEFKSRKLYRTDPAEDTAGSDGPAAWVEGSAERANVGGVSVLPCPAQTTDGVSCSSCRLCFDDGKLRERGYSIGFEVHGIPYAVRQARRALRSPGDPDRRLTAEQQLRRLYAARPDVTASEAAAELDMNAGYAGQILAFLRGQAEHPSVLRRRRYHRRRAA